MNKRIKLATEDWLLRKINAIPLRMWDPTDTQMVVYREASSDDDLGLNLMLGDAPGTPREGGCAGPPAI